MCIVDSFMNLLAQSSPSVDGVFAIVLSLMMLTDETVNIYDFGTNLQFAVLLLIHVDRISVA